MNKERKKKETYTVDSAYNTPNKQTKQKQTRQNYKIKHIQLK